MLKLFFRWSSSVQEGVESFQSLWMQWHWHCVEQKTFRRLYSSSLIPPPHCYLPVLRLRSPSSPWPILIHHLDFQAIIPPPPTIPTAFSSFSFIHLFFGSHSHTFGLIFFSLLFSFSATSEWTACLFPLWSRPFSSGVERIDFLVSSSVATHPKAGWPAALLDWDTAGLTDGWPWLVLSHISIHFKWMLLTCSPLHSPKHTRMWQTFTLDFCRRVSEQNFSWHQNLWLLGARVSSIFRLIILCKLRVQK